MIDIDATPTVTRPSNDGQRIHTRFEDRRNESWQFTLPCVRAVFRGGLAQSRAARGRLTINLNTERRCHKVVVR